MKILNSFRIALAMFSKIPVGKADWSEDNMQFSMCFIPFVGIVNAAALFLWYYLCIKLSFNNILFGTVAAVLPLLITGGIHMDGFCDVVDSLASYAEKGKRLEILKDPHVGAFAIIWCSAYMIVMAGLMSGISSYETVYMIGVGYVLSRAVSCLLSVFMKNAKREGTLYTFTSRQNKNIAACVLAIYIFGSLTIMCIIQFYTGILTVLLCMLTVLYFLRMADKNFGGITGDLAGFFIQICELVIVAAVILVQGRV